MSAELNRLRWRCRRGMRELDMILDRFLGEDWPVLDEEGRRTFGALLEATDPELHDFILGRTEPPAAWRALVAQLQRHRPRS